MTSEQFLQWIGPHREVLTDDCVIGIMALAIGFGLDLEWAYAQITVAAAREAEERGSVNDRIRREADNTRRG